MKTNLKNMFDNSVYSTPTPEPLHTPSITRGIYGFPLESYDVVTDDGYCITLLRIPNKTSKRCVLFVAGILDTAYAWISNNSTTSLGPRVYEAGYDVFLANFRGTDGHIRSNNRQRHKKYSVDDEEYWDFNFDDLALDLSAFIKV